MLGALGVLPAVILAGWLDEVVRRWWARSYMGARLRGWWHTRLIEPDHPMHQFPASAGHRQLGWQPRTDQPSASPGMSPGISPGMAATLRASAIGITGVSSRPERPVAGQAAPLDQSPGLELLIELRDTGWALQPIVVAGEVIVVRGVRTWPDGWTDAIRVRDAADAAGQRRDQTGKVVWRCEGSLVEVVERLRALPVPYRRGAPWPTNGRRAGWRWVS